MFIAYAPKCLLIVIVPRDAPYHVFLIFHDHYMLNHSLVNDGGNCLYKYMVC